jgi:hypothetical protein
MVATIINSYAGVTARRITVGPQRNERNIPNPNHGLDLLYRLPPEQLLFLGLFAATWLIGGNILIVFHYRRLGKPWWSGFRPFAFPFKNFNRYEWLALTALGALSFVFLAIAISFNAHY